MLGAAAAFFAFLALCPTASAAPPASGDWVVTGNETYANQTIIIEGNVFVRAPAELTLINVTLEINSTVATRRGLLVEAGAIFRTRDLDDSALSTLDRTVIRPLSPTERISFVAAPNSSVDLQQSSLWGVGFTQSPANASGVYLQTSNLTLRNVTVFAGYFGVVFIGVVGNYSDVISHNNTYNGIDMDATSRIGFRGLLVADNGQAGVHAAGGRVTVTGASILHNGDGLAIKFGGTAVVSLFDASGNSNGFIALNGATLNLTQGRVTNNTAAGVDARQTSTVNIIATTMSDNPTHLYGLLGSVYNVQTTTLLRGIRGVQLRSGSSASISNARIEAASGDAIDLDLSSADIFSSTFESNAFAGTVSGSNSFALLDSSIFNSTAGGLSLVNSTGVYLHNPVLFNNRGRSFDLVGNSTSLIDGYLVADRCVVDIHAMTVASGLDLRNSTLHAVSAQAWVVSNSFFWAQNVSIIGDVAGASLRAVGGSEYLRGLSVSGLDLRFQNGTNIDVDGINFAGDGELALLAGTQYWYNVTQGAGAGRVRAAANDLRIVGGSIGKLQVEGTARIFLLDVTASLATATYTGTGRIYEQWTTTLLTQWGPGMPAANQPYTLVDAGDNVVTSGQTDGAGLAALGPIIATVGTTAGVFPQTPHRIQAGAGNWETNTTVSIDAPGTYVATLSDLIAPALTIQTPAQGAFVAGTSVNVTGTASDLESGLAEVAWSFDNVSFTLGSPTTSYSLFVTTAFETLYLITVRAVDLAGNTAYAQVSFRIDRTPPTISLTQPANGSALRGPTVRFVGGTEIGAVLTINGTAVPVDSQGDFDANVSLPEGLVVVGLTAVDRASNVFFFEVTLRIDASPPGIVVFLPPNGSTVAGLITDLVGFIEPGATLLVNGVGQIALSNGSFNVSIDLLLEGENRLVLRSVDPAGNANQTEWVVFRDTRAPVASVVELPGNGPWALNASTPHLTITTDEYAFIEASISPGGAATSASGTSLVFSPALGEGSFTLTVRATDAGGNFGSRTFTLRIDLTAPTFALDVRTEGGFVNTASWTVSLSAEAGANVTVGGVVASPSAPGSSTYTATVTLQPGVNNLVIVVADAAGNRAVRTVPVTLDLVAPTLTVSAPTAGASTTEGQITVSGDTEVGANVTVMGRAVVVDGSGHFSTVANVPMGTTTVTVTSTDRAGNVATVDRSVTRTSKQGSLTGLPFLDQNLWAILVLILIAVVAAGLAARGSSRRAQLKDKAASLEREMETARAARNDLNALENFGPRTVHDDDFVSAEEFRRRETEGGGGEPPARK